MDKEALRKVAGLTIQDLGSEVMLYDAQKDAVFILNETARVVWEYLVAGHTEEEIASGLQERFAIQPGHDLLSDIRDVINEFRQKGLLKEL